MNDVSESRAGAVVLMTLGMLVTLACASAIGAAATLVILAVDKPASATPAVLAHVPQSGECTVMAWKTGMIYCFRSESVEAAGLVGGGPAVVVQAQADPVR